MDSIDNFFNEQNMDFKKFDQRHYPVVSAREGYGEWAASYESSVPDQLDIHILERVQSVSWPQVKSCLDMACGTGRIAAWLRAQNVEAIDGIDLTPEMLTRAKARGIYRQLSEASVEQTLLPSDRYDLLMMSLVDEHLADLQPVYREAARLSRSQSQFVVVGMHPFFFMTGMPTHFKDSEGKALAIETHIHLTSDHVRAALSAGWQLQEMHEGLIDDEWIRVKPKWEKYRDYPVNYVYVWSRSSGSV
jgi:ubiquinone/menaquinone biosynthesis C-methylase UbiE